MGEVDMRWVSASEKLDDVSPLRVVPPAEVFDLDTDGFESFFGSLNLYLQSAVGQQEWQLVINKDFHSKPAGA